MAKIKNAFLKKFQKQTSQKKYQDVAYCYGISQDEYKAYLSYYEENVPSVFILTSDKRLQSLWNSWGVLTHISKEQALRIEESISLNIYELSKNSLSCKFLSDDGIYINTTLKSCDCDDFSTRNLPCKHIYKLFNFINKQPINYIK